VGCHSVRPKWSPLHINEEEGSGGRGTLSDVVGVLIGNWNCSNPKLKEIAGDNTQWGDPLHEKIYCDVSETQDDGAVNFKVNADLRRIITNDRLDLNLKYGKNGTYDIHAGIKFDTNSLKSMRIESGDRRLFVSHCREPILPRDFFWDFHQKSMKDPEFFRQVYSYLMRAEIPESVHPLGRAPMTSAKKAMIDTGRGAVDQFIDEIKSAPEIKTICQVDLVLCLHEYLNQSRERIGMEQVKQRVNAVLPKIFTKLGREVRLGDKQIRPPVWVIDSKDISNLNKLNARERRE